MHTATLHEFVRAPWRYHPERLIGGVVGFDWQERRFWLRMRGPHFLFKIGALDSTVCGATFPTRELNSGARPDELRAHLVEHWQGQFIGRLLTLPDPVAPSQPILVGVNASLFWITDESGNSTRTSHAASLSNDMWQVSQTELVSRLKPQWSDADSLPRRAWEWHRLGSEEKSWSQLAWERGSRRELEDLTRAMMHSDAELWNERDLWGINYKFLAGGNAKIESVRAHTILRAPSERIARLGQLFLEHNRARLQRPPLLPALTAARSFSPDGYAFIHLRFSAPSQHERLEAHLFLRDWLADKISAPQSNE